MASKKIRRGDGVGPWALSKVFVVGGAVVVSAVAAGVVYWRRSMAMAEGREIANTFRAMKMRVARSIIADAEKAFDDADSDGNGELSRAELAAFLANHPEVVHALVRNGITTVLAFDEMDINRDGAISRHEFLSAVVPVVVFETTVHDIFSQYDVYANGGGKLSRDQFKSAIASMGTLEEIIKIAGHDVQASLFTELDKDGDGMLTPQEFVAVFANVVRTT
ncbi:uncharacterized protein AMSG_02716 [Thecamonas trahens ATCC 50062]|uniref:EF-hand domain-containing protein n=1 Tax=Thecamonas trahens ATCC 50062 TaxID=461836 RepID=A0A0L0D1W5_THETB|nr:hypothetical protein AMSG_02716 [Thecamonas trahens ATCC 50062]KNC46262.1 hypothetical protein AMSG_02716 [Thecamonas trahens ATCC 50062]|eukprot:XP_013760556.1 hypothetical protein AMSG_02716 [Thecamonas trahens ATCC 50062]